MPKSKRILIVDDEKRILETYSHLLGDIGYRVGTAFDPDDALKLISEEPFDIVFLDQFLGVVKGLDLMKQMAEINTKLYFVIITANGNTELAVEALKRGASDFITKPFMVADLLRSIDYICMKMQLECDKKNILETLEFQVNEKRRS